MIDYFAVKALTALKALFHTMGLEILNMSFVFTQYRSTDTSIGFAIPACLSCKHTQLIPVPAGHTIQSKSGCGARAISFKQMRPLTRKCSPQTSENTVSEAGYTKMRLSLLTALAILLLNAASPARAFDSRLSIGSALDTSGFTMQTEFPASFGEQVHMFQFPFQIYGKQIDQIKVSLRFYRLQQFNAFVDLLQWVYRAWKSQSRGAKKLSKSNGLHKASS